MQESNPQGQTEPARHCTPARGNDRFGGSLSRLPRRHGFVVGGQACVVHFLRRLIPSDFSRVGARLCALLGAAGVLAENFRLSPSGVGFVARDLRFLFQPVDGFQYVTRYE